MILVASISFAIYSIMISITHTTTATQYNFNQTSWPGRSKRSVYNNMPLDLEMRVRYPTGEEADLHWTKQSRYLVNEHLPVMTTFNYLIPDVMTSVGEFIMYHDLEKCSAIVYFVELKKFFGVIGTNYYIRDLPFHFDERGRYTLGTVGEPHVKENEHPFVHIHPDKIFPPPSDSEAWENFLQLSSNNLDPASGRAIDECPGLTYTNQLEIGENIDMTESKTRIIRNPPTDSLNQGHFLEVIVVVTRDIAQPFKIYFGEDHYIKWIVRNYIIYFNAVDMMFQKLPTEGLYINIARIIIEDESMPFDFDVNSNELQFTDITAKMAQFLRSKMFPPDSFDHVFIHTHRRIMDDKILVPGLTKPSGDLYEAKKLNRFYEAVSISVIGFKYYYADYTVAIHEFGRVLKLKLDPQGQGSKDVGQCYAIMQRRGSKCDNCLRWSENSKRQFVSFLSKNRNRCFLMNKPRSLRPPFVYRDLTPQRQCRCFGYNSHIMNHRGHLALVVGLHGCTEPLKCLKVHEDQSYVESTVLPFDGTRCTHTKACWHGECLPFQNYLDKLQSE